MERPRVPITSVQFVALRDVQFDRFPARDHDPNDHANQACPTRFVRMVEMMIDTYVLSWVVFSGVVGGFVAFMIYVPLFKPWFGFRRGPGDHHKKWFT